MRPRLRLDVSAAQRFILRGLNESVPRQEPALRPRVTSTHKQPQQHSKNKKHVGISVYRQLSVLRADRVDWSDVDRCRSQRVDRYINSVSVRRADILHIRRHGSK